MTLKSNLYWLPHLEKPVLGPNQPCYCLTFSAFISSLQTVAVSMAYVTTVQAVGVCVSMAHVLLASEAVSAMSLWGTVGPWGWPSSATGMLAVLARQALPGEGSSPSLLHP